MRSRKLWVEKFLRNWRPVGVQLLQCFMRRPTKSDVNSAGGRLIGPWKKSLLQRGTGTKRILMDLGTRGLGFAGDWPSLSGVLRNAVIFAMTASYR